MDQGAKTGDEQSSVIDGLGVIVQNAGEATNGRAVAIQRRQMESNDAWSFFQ
jgi:hypothetical protein